MNVEVTLSLPGDTYESLRRGADAEGTDISDFVSRLIPSKALSEQDTLAVEGYREMAAETLEFAASAMATVRDTWPRAEAPAAGRDPRGRRPASRRPSPNTCRGQILHAISAITARTGRPDFTMQDVIEEMNRRGTTYADSTIRTHVGSSMCATAPKNHGVVYNDLERVDHGLYRLKAVSGADDNGE